MGVRGQMDRSEPLAKASSVSELILAQHDQMGRNTFPPPGEHPP